MPSQEAPRYTHRAIKYRLLPGTMARHDMLVQTCHASIHTWNHFLAICSDEYDTHVRLPARMWEEHIGGMPPESQAVWKPRKVKNRETGEWEERYGVWHTQTKAIGLPGTGYTRLSGEFTKWKNLRGKEWINECPKTPVRKTLKTLNKAFANFFRRCKKGEVPGYPKFKSKKREEDWSIAFDEECLFRIQRDRIWLRDIGWMRLKRSGPNPYESYRPLSVRIKRDGGYWIATILYAIPESDIAAGNGAVIGVDRNAGGQIADSDGNIYQIDKARMARLEARKKRYQRKLARQVKGSNRREITKRRFNKTWRSIRNNRHDWAHKATRQIVASGSVVVIEDLKPQQMTKTAKGTTDSPGKNVKQKAGLNRVILESAWAKVEWQLGYKSDALIEVPAHHTSQTCHACGHVDAENRETQSKFECVQCGHEDNADINASKNIRDRGLASLSVSTVRTTVAARGGTDVSRPEKRESEEVDSNASRSGKGGRNVAANRIESGVLANAA